MNLAQEVLVLFRTKAKAERGTVLTYCGRTGAQRYRFITSDGREVRTYRGDGTRYDDTGHDALYDLRLISRPYVPAIGHRVYVNGLMAQTNNDQRFHHYSNGTEAFTVTAVGGPWSGQKICVTNGGSMTFDTTISNIRRAP